ncbi:SsrA-binding protein [Sphingobacterium yanglingense]|uniref:SsrA-binding protein n=2 Tax=Sphingobacterium yanglingense TaxID=1437280 RepID=A0A4R6WC23_9SPHI|nr:SsrA-binding protein [Sphingobacterium yanglingense]
MPLSTFKFITFALQLIIVMALSSQINIKNKRASFEYHLIDKYVAGIQLLGTEIKSIREGKANINDSFCSFLHDGLYIRNMHIAEYSFGSFYNHEAKRDRKLLLTKKELKKLRDKGEEKGFTIVPLRIFISERGFAKVEIALAQGKKDFDKRETIKERENKRELDRVMKY